MSNSIYPFSNQLSPRVMQFVRNCDLLKETYNECYGQYGISFIQSHASLPNKRRAILEAGIFCPSDEVYRFWWGQYVFVRFPEFINWLKQVCTDEFFIWNGIIAFYSETDHLLILAMVNNGTISVDRGQICLEGWAKNVIL